MNTYDKASVHLVSFLVKKQNWIHGVNYNFLAILNND